VSQTGQAEDITWQEKSAYLLPKLGGGEGVKYSNFPINIINVTGSCIAKHT
jgi:hypothetical protein